MGSEMALAWERCNAALAVEGKRIMENLKNGVKIPPPGITAGDFIDRMKRLERFERGGAKREAT